MKMRICASANKCQEDAGRAPMLRVDTGQAKDTDCLSGLLLVSSTFSFRFLSYFSNRNLESPPSLRISPSVLEPGTTCTQTKSQPSHSHYPSANFHLQHAAIVPGRHCLHNSAQKATSSGRKRHRNKSSTSRTS